MTIKESLFKDGFVPLAIQKLDEIYDFTIDDDSDKTSTDKSFKKDVKEFADCFNVIMTEGAKTLGVNLDSEVGANDAASEMMFKYIMEHNCDS